MFESLTKRFEKEEKPSFEDKKFQVEMVVTFRKTYAVRAFSEKEAGIKIADKIQRQNKSYIDRGLHFIESKAEKIERIKDD